MHMILPCISCCLDPLPCLLFLLAPQNRSNWWWCGWVGWSKKKLILRGEPVSCSSPMTNSENKDSFKKEKNLPSTRKSLSLSSLNVSTALLGCLHLLERCYCLLPCISIATNSAQSLTWSVPLWEWRCVHASCYISPPINVCVVLLAS